MKFSFTFKGLEAVVKTNELHKDNKHDVDVNLKIDELGVTVDDVNIGDVAALTKELAGLALAKSKVFKEESKPVTSALPARVPASFEK